MQFFHYLTFCDLIAGIVKWDGTPMTDDGRTYVKVEIVVSIPLTRRTSPLWPVLKILVPKLKLEI